MNRKLMISLCVLVMLALPSSVFAEINLPKFIKDYEPAILLVRTYDKDNKQITLGSGFFISENGQFLTNKHVFRGAQSAVVETSNGKRYIVNKLVGNTPELDLVVGQAVVDEPVPALKISQRMPEKGEKIIVFGNPHGMKFSVTEGIVSSIQDFPNPDFPSLRQRGTFLQFSAPVSSGSSGGPLLDEKGAVVGIATWVINPQTGVSENQNFAITSNSINVFLSNQKTSEILKTENIKNQSKVAIVALGGPRLKELMNPKDLASLIKGEIAKKFIAPQFNLFSDDNLQINFLSFIQTEKKLVDFADSSIIEKADLLKFGTQNKYDHIVFAHIELIDKQYIDGYPFATRIATVAVDLRVLSVAANDYKYGDVRIERGQNYDGRLVVSSRTAVKNAMKSLLRELDSPFISIP